MLLRRVVMSGIFPKRTLSYLSHQESHLKHIFSLAETFAPLLLNLPEKDPTVNCLLAPVPKSPSSKLIS